MNKINIEELLESFKKELPNRGIWYYADKFRGTKPRLIGLMTKLANAGVDEKLIEEVIIDLMFISYVERGRQIKATTGLSDKEFIEKKAREDEKIIESSSLT